MSTSTTLTLQQLITAIRQRADMVNSQFITDSELTSYINQSYFELYDLLVQKYADDYFVQTPYIFTTVQTTQFYPLPSDFYKLLGVDISVSTDQNSWFTLRSFMFPERNMNTIPNYQGYWYNNLQYKVVGNQLWLTPVPIGGQTIRLWYVPELTTLVNLSDTVDGISGWTEYIIVDCCIKAYVKEESDPSVFMQQKMALIQRIESAAENRDAANPQRVSDVRRSDYWSGQNGWDWNGGGFY